MGAPRISIHKFEQRAKAGRVVADALRAMNGTNTADVQQTGPVVAFRRLDGTIVVLEVVEVKEA